MNSEKKKSLDTPLKIVVSILLAVFVAWASKSMEQQPMWFILFGIAIGVACTYVPIIFIQEDQEGTPQSLKNNWAAWYTSFTFWAGPVVCLAAGLFFAK